jgi:hypothetical protein
LNLERPNTVAGLEAKKADLVRLRDQLEADLRAVTADIDHLDGAILLFSASSRKSPVCYLMPDISPPARLALPGSPHATSPHSARGGAAASGVTAGFGGAISAA